MTYVCDHARLGILDQIPADVWQEPGTNPRTTTSDPDRYLCIVGDEPADYHGNFYACVYSQALYQREHIPVSAEYLQNRCKLAPEPVARRIVAHYLRNWATMEDDETADLLRDEADRIAGAPMFDAIRRTRERYHANAESITYTSGDGHAPGFGASIYTNDAGTVVATVGETWRPTSYDSVVLIEQTRRTFDSRDAARVWAQEQATAHGYPTATERPRYDLFTV